MQRNAVIYLLDHGEASFAITSETMSPVGWFKVSYDEEIYPNSIA